MWKHKNFINLQLCAGGPGISSREIYVNNISSTVRLAPPYNWGDNQTNNSNLYTISGNTVVWHDGTILQHNGVDVLPSNEVIYNGQYTTRSATPTLTFKHFYDAGTIGSGTVKFRHYSQTEPLPRLATPQNVTADGTTVSWDAVENATSYAVFADGSEIGTVEVAVSNFILSDGSTLITSDGQIFNIKEA